MLPNLSIAEENHIKSIYHLQQLQESVNTNALAGHLKTKPASVTDMLKKLQAKNLLNYNPYKGFRLSRDGNRAALIIIRRHRLWESFLVNKLNFSYARSVVLCGCYAGFCWLDCYLALEGGLQSLPAHERCWRIWPRPNLSSQTRCLNLRPICVLFILFIYWYVLE